MPWLIKLLGGNVFSGIGSVIKTIFGDKEQRDRQGYDLNAATLNQFAAEFSLPRRNWFDSIIDGLNRLPRPIMALGVIALFVWCVVDPAPFAVSMQALGLIPDAMWVMLGTIVAFFFGDRTLQGIMKTKGPSAEQVRAVIDAKASISKIVPLSPNPSVRPSALQANQNLARQAREADTFPSFAEGELSKKEYQKQFKDETKPLSNAAIMEWNRQNQAGKHG